MAENLGFDVNPIDLHLIIGHTAFFALAWLIRLLRTRVKPLMPKGFFGTTSCC